MNKTKHCHWCGRQPHVCERNDCLPDEVKAELARWIEQYGKRWRSALQEHWLHDGIELRYLRNQLARPV